MKCMCELRGSVQCLTSRPRKSVESSSDRGCPGQGAWLKECGLGERAAIALIGQVYPSPRNWPSCL